MATSGQILGDALSGERVYLNWQLASQSIPNNNSKVNWQIGWLYPTSTCRGLRDGVGVINGSTVYASTGSGDDVHAFSSSHLTPSTDHPTLQTAAGQITIAHGSDGTKSFSASVSMIGWEGGGPNFTSNGSNSWALPTIPRNPNAPSTPTIVTVDQTEVAISWTPNPADGLPNTSYTISYGTATDATGATTTSATSPKTITGLSPGVKYYFKVKATNSVGDGPYSSISNATTVAGAYVLNTTYKKAIPYVRDGGVWKLARPYGKILGVWNKSIN
jgi:hypothetical protein